MNVEEEFLNTIKKYSLVNPRDKVLLGVSGGADSMCMLRLFIMFKDLLKCRIRCAHFNHFMREESCADQDFVEKECSRSGIEFVCGGKKVNNFFEGDSLEQTARNLRFDFFRKCARDFQTKKIALAHNKDDVAETVLMRIIRGTALKGLRGILPVSKMKNLRILRPLIGVNKEDITLWLRENKFPYVEDKSNREEVFLRNKIRLRLIPFLREFNPNISSALFNLGQVSALDYEFIYECSEKFFRETRKRRGGRYLKLCVEDLKNISRAARANVILRAIEEIKGDTRRLESRHIDKVIGFIEEGREKGKIDLPGLQVCLDEGWVVIKNLLFNSHKL